MATVITDLNDHLMRAEDPAEALSFVLERALDASGLTRGLLIHEDDGRFEVVAMGAPESLRRLLREVAGDEETPLGAALRSGTAGRIPVPARGTGEMQVLPLCGSGGPGWGAVVLEADAAASAVAVIEDVFERALPLLEKTRRVQQLRLRAERFARERDVLARIIDTLPEPVVLTDATNGIRLVNESADRLLSSRPDDDERRRQAVQLNNLLFGARRAGFASGTQPPERQLSLVDPEDGSDLLFEVVASPLAEVGSEGGSLLILRNVTDANRALTELKDRIHMASVELEERNRRLEWQTGELDRAMRLKSEFLASMSHELRTPINAVLGYTSLMREEIYGELTAKQRDSLDKINTASQHLLHLINEILDLSKIEAGRMPMCLEEVSLPNLLAELADAVEPLVREKRLGFEIAGDEDAPALFTDRTKLKQVLLNLLSNAVKFTARGGVSVQVRRVGASRVQIAVEDTGIGIRSEHLETIFDDFRQVDQTPTREHGGTGLGLSITRRLITLLDGLIKVESRYGEGTCFTIDLPVRMER